MTKRRRKIVLYEVGDVLIMQSDVERAIAEGRARLGDEYAELLEALPLGDGERVGDGTDDIPDDLAISSRSE